MQKPKGTYDVYGDKGRQFLYIEELIRALMEKYHYEYFRTPLFESTELFHRSVGESTDIVTKETYDFLDRGERSMTLRPEGTAGIVRSYIENKYYEVPAQPVKVWYYGPMYRYERPQANRYREFYQFGVEVFGSDDPLIDAEVISIPVSLYRLLGLKGVRVGINSLGDQESRIRYREALLAHFQPHLSQLCEDCQKRFEKNPLRILDCKVDHDLECMKNAPQMSAYLNEESKAHFQAVQKYLDALEIPYEVDATIVRGLDYYTHTVFEVKADIAGFGSQNVLCGGGRYNGLVEQIGGPQTSGVGFALGMERLLNALEQEGLEIAESTKVDAYVIPMAEAQKAEALALTHTLRMNGFNVDMDFMNRGLKSNFKQADRINAHFIVILGEEEMKNGIVTIKNNQTKEEEKIEQVYLVNYLDEKLGEFDE